MEDNEDEKPPQYRKRIKGFMRFTSQDNGEDEYVKILDECPNICSIGVSMLDIPTYEIPEI